MTISSTVSDKNYAGDDAATAFPTTFKFLANGDVVVILRDAANLETTLVETTHYTLTGAGDAGGGTVTMITPPATGEVLAVTRVTAKTQGTDYVENDPFPADVHETALDRLTLITQEVGAIAARAVTAPTTDTDPLLELPSASDRASEFLVFDSSGNVQTSTGTGADTGLRADLASAEAGKGAALVDFTNAIEDSITLTNALTLSAGVYIGGTAAANLLDDYEEDFDTFVLLEAGASSTVGDMHCTKIGSAVTVAIAFDPFSRIGSTEALTIDTVVPWAPKTPIFVPITSSAWATANAGNALINIGVSGAMALYKEVDSSAYVTMIGNDLAASSNNLRLTFSYITDA